MSKWLIAPFNASFTLLTQNEVPIAESAHSMNCSCVHLNPVKLSVVVYWSLLVLHLKLVSTVWCSLHTTHQVVLLLHSCLTSQLSCWPVLQCWCTLCSSQVLSSCSGSCCSQCQLTVLCHFLVCSIWHNAPLHWVQ